MGYTENHTAHKFGLTCAEGFQCKEEVLEKTKQNKELIDFHNEKEKRAVHTSILLFAQPSLGVSFLMHSTFFFLLICLMTL